MRKFSKYASVSMRSIVALLAVLVLPSSGGSLKFASVFSDHMVIQRGQAASVWGWASPGEQVTVAFAGQKKSARVNEQGKWLVKLDPLTASAACRDLTVENAEGKEKSILTDVVIGDVWLCSGQSNMHFVMNNVENAAQEIAAADQPNLRFVTLAHQFAQEPVDDAAGSWKPVSPTNVGACSAVAYYFGKQLQTQVGVPVGLIISSVGGTRIQSWMRAETLAHVGEADALVDQWKNVSADEFKKIELDYRAYQHQRDHVHPQLVKAARAERQPIPPQPPMPKLRCHDCPSSLHNGMIAPLQSFAIRGAVWYQGESNSGQAAAYEKLLPAMIADWREVWGKDLPFLFVQLAPYKGTHPAFREAQCRIWQTTNRSAMVVTCDVGDATNIHPIRKKPVGERLALAARALSYGEALEYSGPVFDRMTIDENIIIVSFKHLGKGLIRKGDELLGFTIAGEDGKFYPAQAKIDGVKVVVTSERVMKPKAVRYGWAFVPNGNLYNKEGLPAVPFRSDAPVKSH